MNGVGGWIQMAPIRDWCVSLLCLRGWFCVAHSDYGVGPIASRYCRARHERPCRFPVFAPPSSRQREPANHGGGPWCIKPGPVTPEPNKPAAKSSLERHCRPRGSEAARNAGFVRSPPSARGGWLAASIFGSHPGLPKSSDSREQIRLRPQSPRIQIESSIHSGPRISWPRNGTSIV